MFETETGFYGKNREERYISAVYVVYSVFGVESLAKGPRLSIRVRRTVPLAASFRRKRFRPVAQPDVQEQKVA
jgi:hypothetical protein